MHRPYRAENSDVWHWLELTLQGTRSNRMGLGAKVTATARIAGESRSQTRWLSAGTGYASQNEPVIHFGLADAAVVTKLEILWPSGQLDVLHNVAVDALYLAREGMGLEATLFSSTTE